MGTRYPNLEGNVSPHGVGPKKGFFGAGLKPIITFRPHMPATASTKGIHIRATRVATREKRVGRPGVQKTRAPTKVKDVLKPGDPSLPKRKKSGNYTTKSPEKNRFWIFTLFAGKNPDGSYKEFTTLDNYNWPDESIRSYLVYGREICPDSGRLHYQGYIEFINRQSASAVRGYLPGARNAIRRGTGIQASVYCKEDGDFVEFGELAAPTGHNGGQSSRRNWDEAWVSAVSGDFASIPANIKVPYYSALTRIRQDHMISPPDLPDVCGEWFFGPPGTGKSEQARIENLNAHFKRNSKWFDGYQPEKHDSVIIEELGLDHPFMGYDLKIWADRYAFPGEHKGTTIMMRPKKFIVTSNYTIAEIFGKDPMIVQALEDRFEQRHFTHVYRKTRNRPIRIEPYRPRDTSMGLPPAVTIVSPAPVLLNAVVLDQEIPSPSLQWTPIGSPAPPGYFGYPPNFVK